MGYISNHSILLIFDSCNFCFILSWDAFPHIADIQGVYKLLEDFAKPNFHKYWTEIHDVTTIKKEECLQFHSDLKCVRCAPLLWHGKCPGDTTIPAILVVSLEVVGCQGQCLRPTTPKDTTRIARVHQHHNRERHTRHAWEGLVGMGVSLGHLLCHTRGTHWTHLRSLWNCKHSSFK